MDYLDMLFGAIIIITIIGCVLGGIQIARIYNGTAR
jgi:hypothetical protein